MTPDAIKHVGAAGHVLPEIAEPFVTTGKGHLHWTITREEEVAGDV